MTKARLSLFQIWNMCFGFFGIQVAFGLQNANVSRIFQTLGAEPDEIPLLWIAAPATGLLVQPIIGYMSDKTWGRFGRRRPYFFVGAILSALALIFMPHSPAVFAAAITLWILDASINTTMEPFRAFVGDQMSDAQRSAGYAMQSFFIGLGAVVGSAMPWFLTEILQVSNTAPDGQIPDSVLYSFYVGAGAMAFAVLWTVFTTKEYSPEQLTAFEEAERLAAGKPPAAPDQGPGRGIQAFLGWGAIWLAAGVIAAVIVYFSRLEKELYVLSGLIGAMGAVQIVAGALKHFRAPQNAFSEIAEDLFTLPKTMRQLAIVQFFSWFALFAMWTQTTPAVTAFHYGAADPKSALYQEGANWVGVLFAAYNGVAAATALLIPLIASRIGRRESHALYLALGAAGLFSFILIRDPALLWIPMIGVGFAWASIVSTPYSILAGALPARKMGVYMGIFNFFIVIPQLLAATILGVVSKAFFGGQAIYALVLGAASMLIAAAASLRVEDVDDPARTRRIKRAPA